MKISVTNKEYRLLLDMLYLAEWMLHSHTTSEEERSQPHVELEQKFLAPAKEYGCEHLVEFSERFKQYFPTRELEEGDALRQVIDDYDDYTFWEELVGRLAERDLLRTHGADTLKQMPLNQRIELSLDHEQKWAHEFDTNGLDNIALAAQQARGENGEPAPASRRPPENHPFRQACR